MSDQYVMDPFPVCSAHIWTGSAEEAANLRAIWRPILQEVDPHFRLVTISQEVPTGCPLLQDFRHASALSSDSLDSHLSQIHQNHPMTQSNVLTTPSLALVLMLREKHPMQGYYGGCQADRQGKNGQGHPRNHTDKQWRNTQTSQGDHRNGVIKQRQHSMLISPPHASQGTTQGNPQGTPTAAQLFQAPPQGILSSPHQARHSNRGFPPVESTQLFQVPCQGVLHSLQHDSHTLQGTAQGVPGATGLFQAPPWRFHHRIELSNARAGRLRPLALQEFHQPGPGLPLCAVAPVHFGQQVFRFTLFTRNLAAMMDFYRLVTCCEGEHVRPGFCLFDLGVTYVGVGVGGGGCNSREMNRENSSQDPQCQVGRFQETGGGDRSRNRSPDTSDGNCHTRDTGYGNRHVDQDQGSREGDEGVRVQLALKQSPQLHPVPLRSAALRFRMRSPPQSLRPLLPHPLTLTLTLTSHSPSLYTVQDPDGNTVLLEHVAPSRDQVKTTCVQNKTTKMSQSHVEIPKHARKPKDRSRSIISNCARQPHKDNNLTSGKHSNKTTSGRNITTKCDNQQREWSETSSFDSGRHSSSFNSVVDSSTSDSDREWANGDGFPFRQSSHPGKQNQVYRRTPWPGAACQELRHYDSDSSDDYQRLWARKPQKQSFDPNSNSYSGVSTPGANRTIPIQGKTTTITQEDFGYEHILTERIESNKTSIRENKTTSGRNKTSDCRWRHKPWELYPEQQDSWLEALTASVDNA